MLIALCLLLTGVVVALAVVNARARRRLDDAVARDEQRSQDLEAARAELQAASSLADQMTRERDEALDRAQRTRRDAAEVGTRLNVAIARADELAAANGGLTSRIDELAAEVAAARRRLDDAQQTSVPTSDEPSFDGELLWALTLARIDRLWRVSVSAGVEATSPLMTSESPLAEAIAIEVGAAREEAGALIDLTYEGHRDVEGLTAATTVGLVEELVAGVIQADGEADLTVTVRDDAVLVSLNATRDGETIHVVGPATLLDDEGRYRIARVCRTADAGETTR